MISAYPHPQLNESLRFAITTCAGVLRVLVNQGSAKEYAALEGRFIRELNEALDMWEQVHDPTSHRSISEWVEKELISIKPHPILLSKLNEAAPVERRIIKEYEEKFWEFLIDFYAKQKRPLFVLEI